MDTLAEAALPTLAEAALPTLAGGPIIMGGAFEVASTAVSVRTGLSIEEMVRFLPVFRVSWSDLA